MEGHKRDLTKDVEHDRWIEKITNALRSFRQAGWSVVAVGTAVAACTAGRDPRPEVNPENAIRSPSPDYMPAMGPAGLGGPQGHEDAGLPLIGPDGGIEPGKFGP